MDKIDTIGAVVVGIAVIVGAIWLLGEMGATMGDFAGLVATIFIIAFIASVARAWK